MLIRKNRKSVMFWAEPHYTPFFAPFLVLPLQRNSADCDSIKNEKLIMKNVKLWNQKKSERLRPVSAASA